MPRIQALDPASATGRAKELLDGVRRKLGRTPNLMRTMANSPAVLEAYLGFSGALAGGTLPVKLREQIALAVAQVNGCDYCLAAHTAIGKSAGLRYVYAGNLPGRVGDLEHTACPRCGRLLIERRGYHIRRNALSPDGRCPGCQAGIPGLWQ